MTTKMDVMPSPPGFFQEGHTIGIRPPSLLERSRICGIQDWAHELGLSMTQLWSAQGNYFDPAAIQIRLHGHVVPFLRGNIDFPRHLYVHPSFFVELYQHLLAEVAAGTYGEGAVLSPLPPDLLNFPAQCALFRATHAPPQAFAVENDRPAL